MTLNKNIIKNELEESLGKLDISEYSRNDTLHPSLVTGSYCWQTTLSRKIDFNGVGLHSGNGVKVSIKPSKEDTGITFIRTDLNGDIKKRKIKANYLFVSDTSLCTTIENEYGIKVSTIEHIMAAFNGSGIDNAEVELDNIEVPIMDGSSLPFLNLIEEAGITQQSAKRKILKILQKVEVKEDNKTCSINPSNGFDFITEIDFDSLAVGKQSATLSIENYGFKDFAANARTFGFMKDVEYMKSLGLGLGGNLENCIIIDNDEVINPDGLRHTNEFSRHKLLDAVGDIFTAGYRIQGCYKGVRSGHYMNNLLLKKIFSSPLNYEIIDAKVLKKEERNSNNISKISVS
jgi:UDP-3-O-[3-hydroxymyristoyl] N-acetylglucosamine deacetylase